VLASRVRGACLFSVVMAAAPLSAASLALASPSNSTHARPGAGVAGVTRLCGPNAAYKCTTGGYAGKSTGWPGAKYGAGNASRNQYGYHNCTLYAAYRIAHNGVDDPGWSDNANGWDTKAASHGTRVDQSPALGSVAQWNGGKFGHLAYVDVVTSTYVEVTDDNYGLNYTDRWRIARTSPAWPDNFIHFKDAGTADLEAFGPAGNLYFYKGGGNGAFVSRALVGNGGWNQFSAIAAADFNGDGKADLEAFGPAGNLYFYKGGGNGAFVSRALVGNGGWNQFSAIAAADFDSA
jgi:surface antigen